MRFLAIASLAAALVGLAPSASHATFPASQQRLLILTEASGNVGLRLLGPGAQSFDLSAAVGIGGSAAMSADGEHIALNFSVPFDPGGSGAGALATSDFLGLGEGGPVASDAARGGRPSWSPDGTRLAYSVKANGKWNIFLASPGSTESPINLTNDAVGNDRNPRWAPDGHAIAFESDRTGDWEVFSMRPDGSNQLDLTNNGAEDRLGDWSPGSDKLVFTSSRTGSGDLYLMGGTGGPATQLTSGVGDDTHAAWSPDGTTIAYSNDAEGSPNVWEIAPDGTNQRRVTNDGYFDLVQDWQPLHDAQAPVTRALPSTGRRHRAVRMKFRVAEDSGAAVVDVEFQYATHNGSSFGDSTQLLTAIKSGRTYSVAFPWRALKGAPASFRFCVLAVDGSVNESARSCARFRFLKVKKKR